MPTNREVRTRIDEMVDHLGQLATAPEAEQTEMLAGFKDIMKDAGFGEMAGYLDQIRALPHPERASVLREMRGVMLRIKNEQYGD